MWPVNLMAANAWLPKRIDNQTKPMDNQPVW
jgi:hypothetical protein